MTERTVFSSPSPEKSIPFFSQISSFGETWPETAQRIGSILDRGTFSNGPQVRELEAALQARTGARHAIGVGNGTDALVLLLRAAGVGPGDEVVVPAFTFAASATSVALTGARPRFADIEPGTYAMDVRSAAAAIGPATKAIMPVHLFCQMADMTGLTELAARAGVRILEDSAEAIGMRWNGVHAGLLGSGGVLSFYPTKTLGAFGDAGMVLTDDDEIARTVRALCNHGRYPAGETPSGVADVTTLGVPADLASLAGVAVPGAVAGYNAKMDELQAAVLLAKLERLDREVTRRAGLAAAYTERLRGVAGVRRLPEPVARDAVTNPVFYVYLAEVDDRDGLVAHLSADRIETEIYYPSPLPEQPCFADLGYHRGQFPHAEAACARAVGLPLYPDLTDDDVDRVCASIRAYYEGGRQ